MSVTRTFLFTDIEGSTRSQQQDPVAWASNHALHDRIVEEKVRANNGDPFKHTGDGYQAAFVTAPEALKAALQIERTLGSTDWQGSFPIRVRAALHTGEAERNQADYLGDDLHRAARVMDAGHGGQVLLSLVTSELVREALRRDPGLAGVELRELGVYALRDLERPERIFQLVAPGLQSSFPALRCEKAFFTNLPADLGLFIGRDEELKRLREQLSGTRLLTITGAGGVGKTRMALSLAREVSTDFKDGVARVELGPLSDPDLLEQTVASVFSVGEGPGAEAGASSSLRDSIIFYLQKKEVLLILDNCEHLLDACTDFVTALLNKSTALKIIATSRERLDIDGEVVYNLPMLAVPAAPEKIKLEDLHSYAAIELFVAEATNAQAAFRVTERNVGKIAEICKRLDGNALAIKLAASLSPTLSVDEMLERLRERFEMLVQGRRQTEPRHRTLKAVMDWSYELLSLDEATVFRRLAVFAGAWSLKAAESVCVDDRIGQSRLVTILNNLVRKNLVAKVAADDVAGDTESRFSMLETIHEYAAIQLRETNELERLQQEHAKYFVAFVRHETTRIWGAEPQLVLSRLERDYDDLVRALEWGRKSQAGQETGLGLQLAAELGLFWERRGFLTEGRERLALALRGKKRPDQDKCRMDALDAAARLAFLQNDYTEAIALYDKSLKIRRQLASVTDDTRLKHGVVGVLNRSGVAALRSGDYAGAEARLLEAMDLAGETNHTRGIVGALNHLAELAWRQGDYEGANKRYEECLAYARLQKGKLRELFTLDALIGQGHLQMMQGKYDEAKASFTATLEIYRSQGNKTNLAYSYSDLSEIAFRMGDYETAWKYAEESLMLRQEARNEWGIANSMQKLGQAKHKLGVYAEALQHARESLSIFERLEYKKGIAECLLRIAEIKFDMGEPGDREIAAKLFGAAEWLLDSLGAQLAADQRDYYESAILAPARNQLDSRLWASGQNIGLETAIRLAQEDAPE
jgi:predicted ATPase/class 3 adenylate cyclase